MSQRRSRLRDLDARVLPAIRTGMRRTGAVLRRPFLGLVRWERDPARGDLVRRLAAHPGAVALLCGVLVFSGSLVHLQRFDDTRSLTGPPSGRAPVTMPGEEAPAEAGPRTGVDLELYVRSRRQALGELAPDLEMRAVVSLADYHTAEEVAPGAGIDVESLLVRLAVLDEPPRVVDVAGRGLEEVGEEIVETELAHLEDEEAELRSVLDSDVEDPQFEQEFERRADELTDARRALEDEADIVFGLVVVATAERLRELQAEPDVRLVDPVGAPAETRSTRLFGVLPENLDRASYGRSW